MIAYNKRKTEKPNVKQNKTKQRNQGKNVSKRKNVFDRTRMSCHKKLLTQREKTKQKEEYNKPQRKHTDCNPKQKQNKHGNQL